MARTALQETESALTLAREAAAWLLSPLAYLAGALALAAYLALALAAGLLFDSDEVTR